MTVLWQTAFIIYSSLAAIKHQSLVVLVVAVYAWIADTSWTTVYGIIAKVSLITDTNHLESLLVILRDDEFRLCKLTQLTWRHWPAHCSRIIVGIVHNAFNSIIRVQQYFHFFYFSKKILKSESQQYIAINS